MSLKSKNEYTIGEALQKLVEHYKMNDRLHQVSMRKHWTDIVGPYIDSKTTEFKYRNKALFVKLNSAPLVQELSMARKSLIEQFNHKLGEGTIERIEFR